MEFRPFLVKAFNAAIPNLFEDVKGFDPNTTIEEADLLFVESHLENLKVRTFDKNALKIWLMAWEFVAVN